MQHYTYELKTADGLKLKGQGWEPESGIKGLICLVHGIGEHSSRYDHVANALNRVGCAVLAIDLRGHGLSEGKRGHTPSYDALMEDISCLLDYGKQRYRHLPIFLYGHSLGGNLVIFYALTRKPELAGVIASAPLLRLAYKPPVWKRCILKLLYVLRVTCTIPRGTDEMAMSHDLNVVRTKRNDPLCHGMISPQLAIEMLRTGLWCLKHASEMTCPFLLMHGDADRTTSAEASREFANLSGDNCTLKIWDGLYHELHNEQGKESVLECVTCWISSALSADKKQD